MPYICCEVKRLLAIPLLFVYILAVSGVMIQLHYCGQELESWNLFAENDGCAGDACGDETEENDGCCKDEVVVAKMNEDQDLASQFNFKFTEAAATLPNTYFLLHFAEHKECTTLLQYAPNAPPGLWQDIPLYKLHARFTYYG